MRTILRLKVGERLRGDKRQTLLHWPEALQHNRRAAGERSIIPFRLYRLPVRSRLLAMAPTFDESEFIDTDYESSNQSLGPGAVTTTTTMSAQPTPASRPPSREEIEAKVSDAHSKLAEL